MSPSSSISGTRPSLPTLSSAERERIRVEILRRRQNERFANARKQLAPLITLGREADPNCIKIVPLYADLNEYVQRHELRVINGQFDWLYEPRGATQDFIDALAGVHELVGLTLAVRDLSLSKTPEVYLVAYIDNDLMFADR